MSAMISFAPGYAPGSLFCPERHIRLKILLQTQIPPEGFYFLYERNNGDMHSAVRRRSDIAASSDPLPENYYFSENGKADMPSCKGHTPLQKNALPR